MRLAAVLLALSILAACSSSNHAPTLLDQEKKVISDLAAQKKITYAESFRRQRDAQRKYAGLDSYDEAYWATSIAVLERYDRGQISGSEAMALVEEASALRDSRQMAARSERNLRCISERQRVAGNDYGGLNSTSGVVAVVSLLSAVGDGVSVAKACD